MPNSKDSTTKVPFIPDEAIKTSEEARKKQGTTPERANRDKYSEDRISPDQPSNEEAKSEIRDTNIKGG